MTSVVRCFDISELALGAGRSDEGDRVSWDGKDCRVRQSGFDSLAAQMRWALIVRASAGLRATANECACLLGVCHPSQFIETCKRFTRLLRRECGASVPQ